MKTSNPITCHVLIATKFTGKHTYRRLVPVEDLQRGAYARFAQVPIFLRAVVRQERHQSGDIHIVVIVEMAEPPGGDATKL